MSSLASPLDRRDLLRAGSLGALGLLARPLAALPAAALPLDSPPAPATLVVLQLTGGNDGYSTVVPYGDDRYHRARPTIGPAPSEILPLDERRGFHPALAHLYARFRGGELAIVEGVGSPGTATTHIDSLEAWHVANPARPFGSALESAPGSAPSPAFGARGRGAGAESTGWLARLAEHAFGFEAPNPPLIHVGRGIPASLRSRTRPVVSLGCPRPHGTIEGAPGGPWIRQRVVGWTPPPPGSAAALPPPYDAPPEGPSPPVPYPSGPFGDSLRSAAGLIGSGAGPRLISLELSGFDTHCDQRRRHGRLLSTLDRGLDAFLTELDASAAGRATVVIVFSELGRRLAENASRGTDHAAAGPVFIAGAGVRGGWFGESPDLDEHDPRPTTDLRSVYATLIESHLGVRADRVLGESVPRLGFLPA